MPTYNTIEQRLTSEQFTATEISEGQWKLSAEGWPDRICISTTAPVSFLFSKQVEIPDPEPTEAELLAAAKQRALARIAAVTEAAKAVGYTGIQGITIPFQQHIIDDLKNAYGTIEVRVAAGLPMDASYIVENGDNDIEVTYQQIADHVGYFTVAAIAIRDAWTVLRKQFNAASTIEEYDAIAAE